jgi:hypothetical protein
MNEAKHTPGEWIDRNAHIPHAAGEIYSGNEFICTTSGNAKANAKLIAAAPDLLEACEKLLSELRFSLNSQGAVLGLSPEMIKQFLSENTLIIKAEAAIQKATE